MKNLFTGLSLVTLIICAILIIGGLYMTQADPGNGGGFLVATGAVVLLVLLYKTLRPGKGETL